MAGARTDPSPILQTSLALKRDPQDHPIAPTEFPKAWSTPETPRPNGALETLRYTHLGRRTPRPSHVDRGQRIPSEAYPPKSGEILSQRPTIHRPQPPGKTRSSRVRLSCPGRPGHDQHDEFARFRQEISAAARTCAGRSALG